MQMNRVGRKRCHEVMFNSRCMVSHYNALNLSLCVCLFPHKIGALQGISSRRSMPVEGLGGHALRGELFT